MDRRHIVFPLLVWFLCMIPSSATECVERKICCSALNCTIGFKCFNASCANPNPCDTNWKYFAGACYYFSSSSVSEYKTWHKANDSCAQYATPGLAEVYTPSENAFILDHIEVSYYWIGAIYSKSAVGEFVWASGGNITEFYWRPFPGFADDDQCLAYDGGVENFDRGWIGMFYDNEARYICKKTVPTEDACGCLPYYSQVCGTNGLHYANRCYAEQAGVTSTDGECSK